MTELPKFNADVSNIIKLDDLPNDKNGMNLSPDEFKAKFDKAPEDIKQYLNEVLLPFLGGLLGASAIGVNPISGISEAVDVQTALELLKFAIDNTATGSIPDGSLTGEKIVPSSITEKELAPNSVGEEEVKDGSISDDKIKNLNGSKIDKESIPSEAYGKRTIKTEHLADGAVDGGKVKEGSLVAKNYAPGSVQAPAIQDGAVSTAFTATIPVEGDTWTTYENYSVYTTTIAGLLPSDSPIVDLDLTGKTGATLVSLVEAWGTVLRAGVNTSGQFYIYFGEKPEVDIPIKILVVRK